MNKCAHELVFCLVLFCFWQMESGKVLESFKQVQDVTMLF